jgi:hypothetical protein
MVGEAEMKIENAAGKIKSLILLACALTLCACGIAAQSIKTEPPGNVNSVRPQIDFREIKRNSAAGNIGSVTIGIVLTMRAGNQRVIAGHPLAILPYSDGFWADCMTLLQWMSAPNTGPEAVARRRDAEMHMKSITSIYAEKLREGNVLSFARQAQTRVTGEAEINDLPEGGYMAITSLRDRYNGVEWAVRFNVKRNERTNLILNNQNAVFIY